MNNYSHIPVLLNEVIDGLKIEKGKKYIDATIGGGGHTEKILEKGGVVLGIDRDNDALEFVKVRLGEQIKESMLTLAKANFEDIRNAAKKHGFVPADGILFDFGLSSYQIDKSGRGFSFKGDEKLDMRMDVSTRLTAFEVVNRYPRQQLVDIFQRFGEEHNASEVAEKIVEARKKKEIATTKDLSDLVRSISHKPEAIDPATRIYQAIRIEVNDELGAIRRGLEDALGILGKKSRLAVISFHSLEDRITKQMFEKFARNRKGVVITKKPLTATLDETMKNKRSRSAKLRIFESN